MACYVVCPSTARGVEYIECAPASVGEYMCVASPASHSTVREGLNLPVWSWRDYGMLLYPARALREGLHKQIVLFERGRVQVCSINRFLQHCARGIEPASLELAGLWHAMLSARALREGWHT